MTVTSCLAPRDLSTFCHPLKCRSASSPAFGDTWPVFQALGRFYSICPSQEPHEGASTILPISWIRSLRHKRLSNLPEVTRLRTGGGALDSGRKAPRGSAPSLTSASRSRLRPEGSPAPPRAGVRPPRSHSKCHKSPWSVRCSQDGKLKGESICCKAFTPGSVLPSECPVRARTCTLTHTFMCACWHSHTLTLARHACFAHTLTHTKLTHPHTHTFMAHNTPTCTPRHPC